MKRFLFLVILAFGGPVFATDLQVTVTPSDDGLQKRLRAASLVAVQVGFDGATTADLLAAARADYGRLISVLYDRGYFGPEVTIRVDGREVTQIPAFGAPAQIDTIAITVTPGPKFTFGRATAQPLAPGTQLPATYATGEPARTAAIRDAAQGAVEAWRDAGHAKAEVSGQKIVADHPRSELNSDLTLNPGPQLRFGQVSAAGSTTVREDRIQEIAGLPVGDIFSPQAIALSAKRLRDTGTFRSVAITEVDAIGPGDTQDIVIELVDEKPRRIGAGAELSSLEGLTLSGLWMHRNLLGGAERLRIEGEVGGIGGDSGGLDFGLSARFDRPATFTPDTGLYLEAALDDLSEPHFDESQFRLEGGLTHRLSDQLRAEVGVQLLTSDFTDDLGSRSRSYLMLPAGVEWDRRDDVLNPSEGTYLNALATPMIGLNTSAAGLRVQADGRWYLGFGEQDRHVAALRVQGGSVIGMDQTDVPPSLLFFSGGGGTVRGQSYQSLTVDLGGGAEVGGRSFLGLSTELRLAATDKIGVVGFADMGVIGDDSFGGTTRSHAGAGLGLRYDTGIGPIRFDVAAPVSGDTGDGLQFYIGIGQAF